jgi:hypothetical protein
VRQALESTPRFASPVHVVDGVSPTPARLHSPKGVICLCGGEDLLLCVAARRVYAPAIGQRSLCMPCHFWACDPSGRDLGCLW